MFLVVTGDEVLQELRDVHFTERLVPAGALAEKLDRIRPLKHPQAKRLGNAPPVGIAAGEEDRPAITRRVSPFCLNSTPTAFLPWNRMRVVIARVSTVRLGRFIAGWR